MTSLEHKKYGSVGSEFIVHHRMYRPRRLVVSLVLSTVLASAFQIYELDVVVLWAMSVCLALMLVCRLLNKVRTEAVVVVPSVGVQVSTRYWLGGLETNFFDTARVRGIVINEAISMHSVLSYLAVLLRSGATGSTDSIFPLFTKSWPGQRDLVYIYQAVENLRLGQTSTPPAPPPPPPPGPVQVEGIGKEPTEEIMLSAEPQGQKRDNHMSRRKRRRTHSLRS